MKREIFCHKLDGFYVIEHFQREDFELQSLKRCVNEQSDFIALLEWSFS